MYIFHISPYICVLVKISKKDTQNVIFGCHGNHRYFMKLCFGTMELIRLLIYRRYPETKHLISPHFSPKKVYVKNVFRQLRTKGLWTFFIFLIDPPSPSQSQCCVLLWHCDAARNTHIISTLIQRGEGGEQSQRGGFFAWGGLELKKAGQ